MTRIAHKPDADRLANQRMGDDAAEDGRPLTRTKMPDEERYPGPIEWLTVPGRLLLILAIVGFVATLYFSRTP